MSPAPRGKSPVPEVNIAQQRYQRWVSRAYGFAALCLATLAVIEATGNATPLARTLLMIGIALAGTVAWVMQAKRICPGCGEPFGYQIRIVNANTCRKCGAEFPNWRPGKDEEHAPPGD